MMTHRYEAVWYRDNRSTMTWPIYRSATPILATQFVLIERANATA
jgi:hypothetical protein